ncbi:MAG TPA: 16S rRNA (guanine(966)-N(2))-methyltransferase RsmD [Candidatus Saccharimonadales bacterium]|nr:16S rRNA (guanine(966)-N(2))-methyltransferase RsmD [Candidatus Saccharimonadales bacterium]
MRIIAGELGGRVVMAPKTRGTRPMTDKVRAALFDAVGSVQDITMLDAYAGSGAVGFEALSRGAQQVVAVESARPALTAIQANQQSLGIAWGYSLYQMSVETWLARHSLADSQRYELIVADPPYDRLAADVLEKLGSLLQPSGWLVVSHSSRRPAPALSGLELAADKVYGDSALGFYKPA